MKYANKILYIGTGCHIKPVTHFKETKEFIFIDTQPRSEFDSYYNKFYRGFYRKHFIENLETEFVSYGFTVDSFFILDKNYFNKIISWKQYLYYLFHKKPGFVNPTVIIFTNKTTSQKVRYYVSTNFQTNMSKILKDDIESCDGMIISGYHPHIDILQHFYSPKIFFGYTSTIYNIDILKLEKDDEDQTIIVFLHNCICNTLYYFKQFYMINIKDGTIIKCDNFTDFLNRLN